MHHVCHRGTASVSQVSCLVIDARSCLKAAQVSNDFISLTRASQLWIFGWRRLNQRCREANMKEVKFDGGQNLKVITAPYWERTTEGTKRVWQVRAVMDTLKLPNNIQTHTDVDLQSVGHFLPPPFSQCKTINSKGTLRSGPYTLFI